MTTDWTALKALIAQEQETYRNYVKVARGDDKAVVRVSPKEVREAQDAWYDTLMWRQQETARLGQELGVPSYKVLMLYYSETTTPKEVKR